MQWTNAELKKDVNDATGTYLQAKLEALATVGKISVSPCADTGTKATWYITFSSLGYTTLDAKNFGALPIIVVENNNGNPTLTGGGAGPKIFAKGAAGSTTSEGTVPFVAYIEPAEISAA